MTKRSLEVVKIPATMERYFGGPGYMVKPDTAAVIKLIRQIPKGKVATLDAVRDTLAKANSVKTSCPAATAKAIKEAAQDNGRLCSWRVIKRDGKLLSQHPGAVSLHVQKLEAEGFSIDSTKKDPRVVDFEKKLHSFK